MKDKDSEQSAGKSKESQDDAPLDIEILQEYHARKARPKDEDV